MVEHVFILHILYVALDETESHSASAPYDEQPPLVQSTWQIEPIAVLQTSPVWHTLASELHETG